MYVISTVQLCITKKCQPPKVGGTKYRASPPLQKVGGHVPLSTHGSTPMLTYAVEPDASKVISEAWFYVAT